MTTNHNFPPTSLLNNRNDLALMYNSLYDEKKQNTKKQNTKRQNEIKLYLKELLIRDKELKEINKKSFYKKREEKLAQVAEDVRQYNAKKEEINTKKTDIKARILELEEELHNYAKKNRIK